VRSEVLTTLYTKDLVFWDVITGSFVGGCWCTPGIFRWGGADPEVIYNLFYFKNYVMKIM
jgi:hypothetical protein